MGSFTLTKATKAELLMFAHSIQAQANLLNYGKTLLSNLPRETTELLIDLCCGTLDRPMESTEPSTSMTRMGKGGSYLSYLSYGKGGPTTTTTTAQISQPRANATASAALPAPTHERTLTASSVETPDGLDRRKSVVGSSRIMQDPMVSEPDLELPPLRQFFPYFVDHPDYFIRFLETVAARRWNQRLESSDMPPPRQRTSSEGDEDGNLREGQSEDDRDGKDQKAVWNTLLELYLTHGSSKTKTTNTNGFDGTSRPEVSEDKALRLLQSKGRIPYDANQALLVCTTTGFVPGLITLYEQMQMHDEIVRFYIDRAESPEFDQAAEARKVFESLAKYGPSNPSLYPLVLRFLTSSESLLSTHQKDFEEILEVVDRDSLMSPIKVVQLLSRNKVASVGMLKQFLTRRIVAERQEIDAVRAQLSSGPIRVRILTVSRLSAGSWSHRLVSHRDREEAQGDQGSGRSHRSADLPSHEMFPLRPSPGFAKGAFHVFAHLSPKVCLFRSRVD
jgi:hypothetical protein